MPSLLITTLFVSSPAMGWWLGFAPPGRLGGAAVVPLAEAALARRPATGNVA